ncbi:MAG: hypothetical protein HYR89_05590 [Actinobacteria bacterium]|nr:hypothetical protein [Actinomycetota bacterium]
MPLYRVRVELEDSPGRLARLASGLGSVGANILSIDVQGLYGASVADEIVLHAPVEVHLSALTQAVERSGARLLSAEAVDHHAAGDAQVNCFDVARYMVEGRGSAEEASLVFALGRVVRADSVLLLAEDEAKTGLAHDALREQQTVTGQGSALGVEGEIVIDAPASWVMAAPYQRSGKRWVAVMVRGSPEFTSTEAARIRSFLRFVSVTEDLSALFDMS